MNSDRPSDQSRPDERVDALIDEYFDRKQAGEQLTPETFAARHGDVADLLPYLKGLSLLDRVYAQASEAEDPGVSPDDDGDLPHLPGYELREEIGHGGMGVVYRALQVSTNRVVALKVMLTGSFASPSARRRFEREVRLAARLQHPDIVRVLESGRVERQQYYAMDYVDGVPLDRHLRERGPDIAASLRLFIRVCAAVDYAHRQGVVHRDLKPANVLVDDGGAPHILDFGLAKAIDQAGAEEEAIASRVSRSGQVIGTLPYIAPEQAEGESDAIDARTDVYALGVMLYETLTGALPYDTSGSASDVIRRIREDPPLRPSSIAGTKNGDLETIVLKALAKEQERRYQSAPELADDLRRYLEGEPIRARRPSRLYVLRKKIRKHPLVTCLGLGAVLLSIVAIVALTAEAQRRRESFAHARSTAVFRQQMNEGGAADRALDGAKALMVGDPELPEACLVYAQARYRAGRQEDAIILLEQALEYEPSRWECRMLLAAIRGASGNTAQAEAMHARAEREAPDTAEAWYLRSFATLDTARALPCAEAALDRDPSFVPAWQRLAFLRLRTGDPGGAVRAAETLIELGERWVQWTVFIGHALTLQGRHEEAAERYSEAIRRYPDGLDLLRYRARVHRRLNDHEAAVDDYTRLLEAASEEAAVVWDYYQRATPLWILGRTGEAVDDYRRVRMLLGRPSYGDARRFLILRERGAVADANAVLDAALRDVGDDWLRQIFRCLDGQITHEDLITDATRRDNLEQLCEAYFYAGEACLLADATDRARAYFMQCVDTGLQYDPDTEIATPMNEFELARWRLETRFGGGSE